MSDRTLTLADLCNAIAEGRIAVSLDGSSYQVNALELRRYLNRSSGLPSVSPASTSDPLPHSESSSWSAPVRTSVA